MKIRLLCINDNDKHFKQAIEEYIKRMSKQINIVNIKQFKSKNPQQVIEKETHYIIEKLQKDDNYKILLNKDGKTPDTIELANTMRHNPNITFIIGGPYGLDEKILNKYIDYKLSFGKMTLAHGLAKLVLLEQIYRINTIMENKKYHY